MKYNGCKALTSTYQNKSQILRNLLIVKRHTVIIQQKRKPLKHLFLELIQHNGKNAVMTMGQQALMAQNGVYLIKKCIIIHEKNKVLKEKL